MSRVRSGSRDRTLQHRSLHYPAPGNREPVLDTSRIEVLADELCSVAAAKEFMATFLGMLPERVAAVEAALSGADPEISRTAVLSLAASAAMAGARQLERDARLIDADLRSGEADRARLRASRLCADAAAVESALKGMLERPWTAP
jgi:HPt (histidine-containing phosphotransfer) domain-containing protein